MGSLSAYSGLTTKIKAMRSHLLRKEQYKELAELSGIPEAIAYLKQIPSYHAIFSASDEHELHRGQIERLLRTGLFADYRKIYNFASQKQRKFLKQYYMLFEAQYLKLCMTRIFGNDEDDKELDVAAYEEFLSSHSPFDFQSLHSAQSLEEFRESLKGTEYYEPFQMLENMNTPTMYDYEITLDLYVFQKQWKDRVKLVGKEEVAILEKILGTKFDMLNMQWIWRAKKYYNMSPSAIYTMLLPVNYRLKKQELKAMVEAESMEALNALIEESYYRDQFELQEDNSMETLYISLMSQVVSHESKKDPYSVAMVYAYLYHREHEIDRVTVILECLRYGVSPEETLKHLSHR